jgi:hypothetical protein
VNQTFIGKGQNSGLFDQNGFLFDDTTNSNWGFQVNSGGGAGNRVRSATAYAISTWVYLVGTYADSTHLTLYINGTSAASGGNGIAAASGAGQTFNIGSYDTTADFVDGLIDEGRVATVARSADWVITEYNNQFSPGTFETLGSQSPFPPPVAGGDDSNRTNVGLARGAYLSDNPSIGGPF